MTSQSRLQARPERCVKVVCERKRFPQERDEPLITACACPDESSAVAKGSLSKRIRHRQVARELGRLQECLFRTDCIA